MKTIRIHYSEELLESVFRRVQAQWRQTTFTLIFLMAFVLFLFVGETKPGVVFALGFLGYLLYFHIRQRQNAWKAFFLWHQDQGGVIAYQLDEYKFVLAGTHVRLEHGWGDLSAHRQHDIVTLHAFGRPFCHIPLGALSEEDRDALEYYLKYAESQKEPIVSNYLDRSVKVLFWAFSVAMAIWWLVQKQ